MAHSFSDNFSLLPQSSQSLQTNQPSREEKVPNSIVGTRIRQLNTIATPGKKNRVQDTVARRERENTTIGWGRRAERSFAKPASRNTIFPDETNSQLELAHHAPRHTETSKRSKLPSEVSPTPLAIHNHDNPKPATPTGNALIAMAELKQSRFRARLGRRRHNWTGLSNTGRDKSRDAPPYSQSPSSTQSIESVSVGSSTMRQHAREIFDEYGISRPQGWLSEASSTGDEEGIHEPMAKVKPAYRLCHSCHLPVSIGNECHRCGHDSCIKCTSEMPLSAVSLPIAQTDSLLASARKLDHASRIESRNNRSYSKQDGSMNTQNQRESSRDSNSSGSTTRPSEIFEQTPTTNLDANTLGDHGVKPKRKMTVVRAGNPVKNSPFIQADRGGKALVSDPQTSIEYALARRPYRQSDCVPRRDLNRSISQSFQGQIDVPNQPVSHPPHIHTCPNTRSTSPGSTSRDLLAGQPKSTRLNQHRDDSSTSLQKLSDPLQKKIDQLYHHAENLHHSRHIMEHLAAGTRDLARPSPGLQETASANENSKAVPASLWPHSVDEDEKSDVTPDRLKHDIDEDIKEPIGPSMTTERMHSISKDNLKPVHQQIQTHSLGDHPMSSHDLSPKSQQSDNPLTSPSGLEYRGPSLSRTEQHPQLYTAESSIQKARMSSFRDYPGLPPAIPVSREAIPRNNYNQHPSNLAKAPTGATTGSWYGEKIPRSGQRSQQLATIRGIPKEQKLAKVQGSRDSEHHQPQPDEAHVDAWPGLRRVDASPVDSTVHNTEKNVPWSQQSLRRISEDPQAHLSHHEQDTTELVEARQHLRPVEKEEHDTALKPSTLPHPQWRLSPSRLPRSPQTLVGKEYNCGYCHPSQDTPSTQEQDNATPGLFTEDGDPNGYTDLGFPQEHQTQPYFRDEWLEPTPSRLKLRDLEHSLARHSAEELLKDQAGRGSPDKAKFVQSKPTDKEMNKEVKVPRIHNPKPFLPPDHACEWRTRCMDLNSEVHQLKSEMSSQEDINRPREYRSMNRVDVGVGDALARHECDEFGIEGLTIVLHMRGKDDLVINTDLDKDSPAFGRR